MMIDDPFSTRFNDEVSWAFRIFDIDNSGSIAVEEINDSVQVAFVDSITVSLFVYVFF